MKLSELPKCPECNASLSFWQSFKNVNSKIYKCPKCKQRIVASKIWKRSTIAGGIVGLIITAIAIFQEEQGYWQTSDSILFFVICLVAGILITYLVWLQVEFNRQDETQDINVEGTRLLYSKFSKSKKIVFITVAIPLFTYIYLGNFHTQLLFFYVQKIKYGNEIHLGIDSYKLADEYAIASNKKGSYLVFTKDSDLNEHNLFYDQINNYLNEDEIGQLDSLSSRCFVLKDKEETDSGLRVIELILLKKILLVVKTNKHQINSSYYCESISA